MNLGPYTVADFPAPSQPDAGALTAAAILEADGVHVAWLDADGGAETVVPSTAKFRSTCALPWDAGCPPGPCQETGGGVSPTTSDHGDFALAWTSDGVAWLAYLVTQYDVPVHYMAQPGSAESCVELVNSLDASRVLHLARVPLDGSPSTDVLRLPIPSTGGARAARAGSPLHPILLLAVAVLAPLRTAIVRGRARRADVEALVSRRHAWASLRARDPAAPGTRQEAEPHERPCDRRRDGTTVHAVTLQRGRFGKLTSAGPAVEDRRVQGVVLRGVRGRPRFYGPHLVRSTLTLREPELATARSGRPSPPRSATATAFG